MVTPTILSLPTGTPPIYYHGINFWVEMACIVAFYVSGFFLLLKKKDELETHRKIKVGYALFMWFFAACRIFFIIAAWFPSEPWAVGLAHGAADFRGSYDFFVIFGYIFSVIGMTAIIYVVEKYLITKLHKLFTTMGYIIICIYSLTILAMSQTAAALSVLPHPWLEIAEFLGQQFAVLLSKIIAPIFIGVIVILYFYLAIKGTASLRRNAILIIIAIALIGIGSVIDGEGLVIDAATWFPQGVNTIGSILDIYYSIVPAIMMVGLIIFVKVTY